MNQGREQQKVLRHKSPVERRKESKRAEKERSAGTIVNRFKAKRMFVCEQMTESGKKLCSKKMVLLSPLTKYPVNQQIFHL